MLVEMGGVQPVLIKNFETRSASNAETMIEAIVAASRLLLGMFFGAVANRCVIPMIRGIVACGINILLLIIAKKFNAACPAGLTSLGPLVAKGLEAKNKLAARSTRIRFPP